METIETKQVGSYTIKVSYDEDPYNPREDDNLGRMVTWHSRYKLGDEQPKVDGREWIKEYQEENPDAVVFPLYLYDHSGITMATTPFSCPWDSGQVGWIVCSKETYQDEGLTKKEAEKVLQAEVEIYDMFLRNDVYGYIIEDEEGEIVEGCSGFFGDPKECMLDAKAVVQAWMDANA